MKSTLTIAGIILIIVGIVALSYQGITYTQTEKVAEVSLPAVGELKVTEDRQKTIPIPPILGALSIAAGIALVVIAKMKNKP